MNPLLVLFKGDLSAALDLINNAAVKIWVTSCKVFQVLQNINKFISRGFIPLITKLTHTAELETLLNFYWLKIWGSLRILFSFSEISFLIFRDKTDSLLLRTLLLETLLFKTLLLSPLLKHTMVFSSHLLLLYFHGTLLLVHVRAPTHLLFLSPALRPAALAHAALWSALLTMLLNECFQLLS